jgi:hypothetical protein
MALVLSFVLIGVVVLLILEWTGLQHWLAVHTGTVNESGIYYGFWSGFGADLGEVTLITTVGLGVYTGVRKANCHTKGCWRIGHHQLDGTPYHLCAHHHPDVPEGGASHEEILEHGRRAREERKATRAAESAATTAAPDAASPTAATPTS